MFSLTNITAGRPFMLGVLLATLLVALLYPVSVEAQQQFVPLVHIPYIGDFTDPANTVNGIIRLLFVIASLLDTGMIIYGGLRYLTSEAYTGKSDGREIITDALIGLLLLLVSVLILSLINPDILNIRLFSSNTPPISTPSSSALPPGQIVAPDPLNPAAGGVSTVRVPALDPSSPQYRTFTSIARARGQELVFALDLTAWGNLPEVRATTPEGRMAAQRAALAEAETRCGRRLDSLYGAQWACIR
jgi:hypothetical protein